MPDALIGYTGFVGTTLLRQRAFDERYNSKNIETIAGRAFDLLVCAGAPAAKWLANKEPEKDRANLQRLQENLAKCSARRVILISTIDVYGDAIEVDESTPVKPEAVHPYGKHRYELEQFVAQTFPKTLTLRLPALFGQGLKKNFIFDLLNANCLDWTHKDSVFQFYDMSRLWRDCETGLRADLPLLNLATAPLRAGDIAAKSFGMSFENVTQKPPMRYDMRTKYAGFFGRRGNYIADADECLDSIKRYVAQARGGNP